MGIRTYTKRVLNFRRQAIVEQKTAGGIPSAVHLPVLRLFDRDRLFLRQGFLFLLRNQQLQHAVLERCLDILLRDFFTHIEAALHRARITLLPNQLAVLFLVLIQVLLGINREVTVVQLQLDLFLRKARQVDIDLV